MTVTEQAGTIDPQALREVLGYYPTGVTVITAIDAEGRPEAMTVGTFTSISLDPPLVGFLPAQASKSFARLRSASSFCVNVLGADQEVLCRAFASSVEDKFSGVEWSAAPSGSPIIDGAVAWIDADFEQVTEVGDHYLVVGRVRALEARRRTLPLLFFERGYGRFAPLQFVTRSPSRLIPVLSAVEAARPVLESAARELRGEVVVTVAVDDQIVHAAVVGGSSIHPSSIVGRRLPLAPPLGSLLIAYGDEAHRDAWLDRSSRAAVEGDREQLIEQLERVRTQGWVRSRKSPRHEELDIVLDAIAHDVHTPGQGRELLRILDELRDSYDDGSPPAATTVRMLAVPVFDEAGDVPFQIGVHDLEIGEDDPRLDAVRDVLLRVAARVSALPTTQALGAAAEMPDRDQDEPAAEGLTRTKESNYEA